jgi:hypothetical protein
VNAAYSQRAFTEALHSQMLEIFIEKLGKRLSS